MLGIQLQDHKICRDTHALLNGGMVDNILRKVNVESISEPQCQLIPFVIMSGLRARLKERDPIVLSEDNCWVYTNGSSPRFHVLQHVTCEHTLIMHHFDLLK